MAFWGVEVKPNKPFTHGLRGRRLHISQATLGIGTSPKTCLLQCNLGNKSPILLCSLMPDKTESCPLNHEFDEEEDVIFSVLGPRSVHLSGFYLHKAHGDGGDETDSYGEDIGESESDHSTDFDTEDEYEDDFIDDGDISMSPPPPRPRSGVVIEEISDDEKPANGNGDRKRLKKKYQVSDSDSDDQKQVIHGGGSSILELESEDEDALPISSLSKTKDETRQEKPDKKVSKGSKKKAEDGHDQVAGTKRKSQDVHDAGTGRGIEISKDSTLPPSEAVQESDEKPKKKKKKERTKKGKTLGVEDDKVVDVQIEDEVKIDNIRHEEAVRGEAEEKPSTDKSVEIDADHAAEEDASEKKKKKKKKHKKKKKIAESDGNANIEEAIMEKAESDGNANTEEAKESVMEKEDGKSRREARYKDMNWKDLVRLAAR